MTQELSRDLKSFHDAMASAADALEVLRPLCQNDQRLELAFACLETALIDDGDVERRAGAVQIGSREAPPFQPMGPPSCSYKRPPLMEYSQ